MAHKDHTHPKSRRWLAWLALLLILGAAVAAIGWYKLFREEPQQFESVEEYYRYGSIGTEPEEGLPYWVWRVLPTLFPQHLPGDGEDDSYAALGVAWEEGQPSPVGFSLKTIGFPRIGINCAACHTATYRTAPDGERRIVPAGPHQTFDPQAYLRFLSDAAADPDFTADNLLAAIREETELSWLDRLLYRFLIIPRTRDGLLEQAERFTWTEDRPRWGPGRIDPFNPVKFHPDLLALNPAEDDTIGNSDIMPLWAMDEQEGYALHWDGLNDSLTEVVLSGAIGDGARPDSLPVEALGELEAYLRKLAPPSYPFNSLDQQAAARGEVLFEETCAGCHGPGGARTGTVIPQPEVGTDNHRLAMWTAEAAERYNAYAEDYPWDFDAFVKTDGYVAKPLTGIWLRAPYLHNGSVPTVEDLLRPAEERPEVFHRGYDVYHPDLLGFIHEGEDAERHGFRYDTNEPGNGNAGHEYGTELPAEDRDALVEYLKTL
ncbi:c-type cytochrome [Halomonas daqiaonensis]|uniref:Cytochrome C oxidase, cbb3-type, subunit III n=1 Tax=Halomonas daqiaonensis TaxID=650850 RepID=A0A1H7TGN2_9GAMM|nr:c-type cytochrome [Halomonas daqiaonensis]SEL83873.1 Cytochrome C oxidase, cbb3-type, subunit III [Halomonas daqiaonensis]